MPVATPPYAELHCHSAYSFLDGASLPDELAQRAAELGYTALALTDHNSVCGSMELAQSAPERGVKAIQGAEVDVLCGEGPTRHLTLLVRDGRGWRNLCRILTLAHAHTREGAARRDLGEAHVELQEVLDHAEGLVCLSGCASRAAVLRPGGAPRGTGGHDEQLARRLLDGFGPEGLYVELQRPFHRHDRARNRSLERSPGGCRCAASPPATSTPTPAAGPSCRTPSWRWPTTPRSTPASRWGGATTAT